MFPRNPRTSEWAVTGIGSRTLTTCWKQLISCGTYTVSGFPIAEYTCSVINCARVENNILSSSGSHRSLSPEGEQRHI